MSKIGKMNLSYLSPSAMDLPIDYPPEGILNSFSVRSIRFGNLRTSLSQSMAFHIAVTGLYFCVRIPATTTTTDKEKNENFNIHITWRHVDELKYYLGSHLALIFVLVTPQASDKLRTMFGIEEKDKNEIRRR